MRIPDCGTIFASVEGRPSCFHDGFCPVNRQMVFIERNACASRQVELLVDGQRPDVQQKPA